MSNPKRSGGGNQSPPNDIVGRSREGEFSSGGRTEHGSFSRGPSGGGPAGPGGPPAPPGAVGFTLQSPYVVRPPTGIDFNGQDDSTGLNNGNTPFTFPGSVIRIPVDSVGVIRSVSVTVNNLLLTSDIFWRIRFNQVPVAGWNRIAPTPGAVAYYNLSFGPDETYIRVPEGSEIDVQFVVTAADAATYLAGVVYHGWYFSKGLADRVERGYR